MSRISTFRKLRQELTSSRPVGRNNGTLSQTGQIKQPAEVLLPQQIMIFSHINSSLLFSELLLKPTTVEILISPLK